MTWRVCMNALTCMLHPAHSKTESTGQVPQANSYSRCKIFAHALQGLSLDKLPSCFYLNLKYRLFLLTFPELSLFERRYLVEPCKTLFMPKKDMTRYNLWCDMMQIVTEIIDMRENCSLFIMASLYTLLSINYKLIRVRLHATE